MELARSASVTSQSAAEITPTIALSPSLRKLIRGLAEIAVDLYLQDTEGNGLQPLEREGEMSDKSSPGGDAVSMMVPE